MTKFRELVENILKDHEEQLLLEAKQVGLLYHNTPNLYEILKSNKLEGYFSIGISFDKHEGWFNDRGWHEGSNYTLILDGNKLSENYKLIETNRSKGEILAIPPHQEIKTYKKELNKVIDDLKKRFNASDEDINKYIYFQDPENYCDCNKEERKAFINYFQKKYFNLEYPRSAENLSKLNDLIYFYSQASNDKYEHDLETPLVINNLNKYLVGLIVRYPFEREVRSKFQIDQEKLNKYIYYTNKALKMFKGMYPNLPIYLRDPNGHKALLKNIQIDQLPEIKAVNYKSRTWRDHETF